MAPASIAPAPTQCRAPRRLRTRSRRFRGRGGEAHFRPPPVGGHGCPPRGRAPVAGPHGSGTGWTSLQAVVPNLRGGPQEVAGEPVSPVQGEPTRPWRREVPPCLQVPRHPRLRLAVAAEGGPDGADRAGSAGWLLLALPGPGATQLPVPGRRGGRLRPGHALLDELLLPAPGGHPVRERGGHGAAGGAPDLLGLAAGLLLARGRRGAPDGEPGPAPGAVRAHPAVQRQGDFLPPPALRARRGQGALRQGLRGTGPAEVNGLGGPRLGRLGTWRRRQLGTGLMERPFCRSPRPWAGRAGPRRKMGSA